MAAEPYRDSIFIEADPEQVFDYFTRPEALVRWMGDRAVLDPRTGGEFTLFFDDRCVRGRYVEIDRPRRLVISWGREGSREMPPGFSTLEVAITPEPGGSRVSAARAIRYKAAWRSAARAENWRRRSSASR